MNIQTNQIITNMYISHQTSKFSQIQILAHRPVQDLIDIDATGQYGTKPIWLLQSSTICMIYCVSVERLQESYSKKKKKKKLEESWFERSKEKGNTVLEKLGNWWCIIGLRTLGFFFFCKFFFYIILIWHQNNAILRLTLILISVPKLHRFGISLKKKKSKLQHFNFKP